MYGLTEILKDKRKLEKAILGCVKIFEKKSGTRVTDIVADNKPHPGQSYEERTFAVSVRSEDRHCVYKGGA